MLGVLIRWGGVGCGDHCRMTANNMVRANTPTPDFECFSRAQSGVYTVASSASAMASWTIVASTSNSYSKNWPPPRP